MSARTPFADVPLPALLLGAGGLVPFVALALLSIAGYASVSVSHALATYAAVILSFVGALHWGYAVQANSKGRIAAIQYCWSVLPALIGWFALQLPLTFALRAQALTFIICYALDRTLATAEATPHWFMNLRAVLSAVAVAALLLASYA
jgi:hypothetical protein